MYVKEHKRYNLHLTPGETVTLCEIIDFCQNMPDCKACPMYYCCKDRFKESNFLFDIIQDLIDGSTEGE